MAELAYTSAIAIARKIRRREISSREAVDYFLARVAALDKPINSVVTIDAERARTEADAADAALARGEVRGPLHGVPMTIKDSFQTAGMRTTSGAPELSGLHPARRCMAGRAAARSRSDHLRQDQSSDLRRRLAELQRSLRHDQQSLRSIAHSRRIVGRFGRCARMRLYSAGTRQRYRRIDSTCPRICRVWSATSPAMASYPRTARSQDLRELLPWPILRSLVRWRVASMTSNSASISCLDPIDGSIRPGD